MDMLCDNKEQFSWVLNIEFLKKFHWPICSASHSSGHTAWGYDPNESTDSHIVLLIMHSVTLLNLMHLVLDSFLHFSDTKTSTDFLLCVCVCVCVCVSVKNKLNFI